MVNGTGFAKMAGTISLNNCVSNMADKLNEWLQTLLLLMSNEFSEVHIDLLSPEYKNSSTWIYGAMKCLEKAVNYVEPESQGIICTAFALVGDTKYLGINYYSCYDLSKEMGLTPPSLYYFGESVIPWHNPYLFFQQVNLLDFPFFSPNWKLLHLEYLQFEEQEYRRSLWVVPNGKS